jgi:NADH-quinone oxidoreductase subunit A
MPQNEFHSIPLWPLLLYASIVAILLAAILALSYILGQHHRDRATNLPYEGGIEQTGSARLRFSAQFYLVAMLFVNRCLSCYGRWVFTNWVGLAT